MSVPQPVQTSPLDAGALVEFLETLGINPETSGGLESGVHAFGGLIPAVPVAAFKSLTLQTCRPVIDAYGASLKIEIATDTDVRLTISTETTDDDVSEFVASISASTTALDVNVSLDKEALVARSVGAARIPDDVAVVGFMFGMRAKATIEQSPAKLEEDLWARGKARVIVLLGDTAVDLQGTWLSVLGPQAQSSLGDLLARPAPDPVTAAEVIKARDRLIGWDEPFAVRLTPWHFIVTGASCDIANAIATKLAVLTILYTCDRARRATTADAAVIRADYRSRDDSTVVEIPLRGTVAGLDTTNAAALIELVDWCYREDSSARHETVATDRLPLLQAQITKLLANVALNDRLNRLVRGERAIVDALDWQWKVFIENKVGDYLDQIDKVGAAVTTAVSAYSASVGELTKGLQDAVVAAVAAVLGSMIAAAFATPFNAALFRVGMFTYAGYVLFFPFLVGVIATSNRVALAWKTWTHEQAQFADTIKPAALNTIVGTRIADATQSFARWRVTVSIVYTLLIAATIVGALLIPRLV